MKTECIYFLRSNYVLYNHSCKIKFLHTVFFRPINMNKVPQGWDNRERSKQRKCFNEQSFIGNWSPLCNFSLGLVGVLKNRIHFILNFFVNFIKRIFHFPCKVSVVNQRIVSFIKWWKLIETFRWGIVDSFSKIVEFNIKLCAGKLNYSNNVIV